MIILTAIVALLLFIYLFVALVRPGMVLGQPDHWRDYLIRLINPDYNATSYIGGLALRLFGRIDRGRS